MVHVVKQMVRQQVNINIEDDGPYNLSGSFELLDDEGNTFETEGPVSLCRCGYSGDKPFCDGTHEAIDFSSRPRAKS